VRMSSFFEAEVDGGYSADEGDEGVHVG